ncbi:hypothetical protein SAY87_015916 [Trapa incisa]|uniref:Uncharacterized protein n=1 Tax=Trapa incisa TaxID=236973 RepID=A0AAN7QXL3_9MYRT|nr:hypothetical protein SAY87_015916 [Trapa incisa]
MPNPPVHNSGPSPMVRPSGFGIAPHADLSPEVMLGQILESVSQLHDRMDNVLVRLMHIERNIDNTQREMTYLRTAFESLNGQNKNQNVPSDLFPLH